VQAFAGSGWRQMPSSWRSAWQRCSHWRAQRQLEGRQVLPSGDARAETAVLARLLDRKAGSERRNHGRHSRRSGFGDTDMAAIVNKKAAPKLTELVLEDVVEGISGSIV
jgi:hypothetical protein